MLLDICINCTIQDIRCKLNLLEYNMKQIIVLLLIFILISCGTSVVKSAAPIPLYEVLTQQSYGGASIRFFEILSEENEIAMLQKDENLKGKIKPNDLKTSNFVVLNLGERTSGGYTIDVESVIETENSIILTVKETGPKSGSITTDAITTPFCVVKVNSKKELIIK